MDLEQLVACHECDLLHHRRTLANGSTARCRRCQAVLYRQVDGVNNLEQLLALTVAALILYLAANLLPFLAIDLNGQQQHISLVSGVLALFSAGMWFLACFAFVLILLVPLLRLLSLLSLLWMVRRGQRVRSHLKLFRLLEWLRPWSMMEIYLLGALVTMVKLASVATLLLGTAFWAFAALIVISSWISSHYDGETLCQALHRIR